MRALAVALALFAGACLPELSAPDGGTPDGGTADGGTSDGGTATVTPATACFAGAETDVVPNCAPGATRTLVDVPKGCRPTVDGTLHDGEWDDGACLEIPGDLTVRVKYAGDALYLGMSGTPSCACPFPVAFDPDGNARADGDEFAITVSDAPFGVTGDRASLVFGASGWTSGAAPGGIEVLCPGNQPNPVRFEWRVPFAALGIQPGSARTLHFAITHAGVSYPDTLQLDASGRPGGDTASWATFESTAGWK